MRAADAAGGELFGRLAPVFIGLVVEDVVGAEFFEGLGFGVGGGGGDDAGAGCFGELSKYVSEQLRDQVWL